jgi:hypothetical protein
MRTIMQMNAFVTAFRNREKAEAMAAQFEDDPEITAKVIQRRDGKFVIELRNEVGEFLGCL